MAPTFRASRGESQYQYDLMTSLESSPTSPNEETDDSIFSNKPGVMAKIQDLDKREEDLMKDLGDLDALWHRKRQPYLDKMDSLKAEREEAQTQLKVIETSESEAELVGPRGPEWLSFVDETWFGVFCNIVVALNMTAMVLAPMYPEYHLPFTILDNMFLMWYVIELSVKYGYHRSNLFFGKISVVWWNWLDLFIVVSGLLDQWLVPLIGLISGGGGSKSVLPINTKSLRTLRFLRLFRVLRFLKLIRAFLQGEMKWAQSPEFEVFMSIIIGVNAIVMSLELDYEWSGWVWVENVFLTIYLFEVSVKLKVYGWFFFRDGDNCMWNYLDFTIVFMGVLDLWLMPLIGIIQITLFDSEPTNLHAHGVTSLLRLMRIFRILRLVKLLKTIKPLYRLLLGVVESLKAMQWVMVLTLLMLYGGAIFWTSLVGHGLIYLDNPPEDIEESFGSVPKSLFSLFRLMNGDTDVVKGVFSTVAGQLLFVGFMVLANWAILAILTSVVSDNMIAASQRVLQEEEEKAKTCEYSERVTRLRTLFKEIDSDGSGAISKAEWDEMFEDSGLLYELCHASALTVGDLDELWGCLSVQPTWKGQVSLSLEDQQDGAAKGRLRNTEENIMYYDTFIACLRDEGEPADKRAILRMMSRLDNMERKMDRRFDEIWTAVRRGPNAMGPLASSAGSSFGYGGSNGVMTHHPPPPPLQATGPGAATPCGPMSPAPGPGAAAPRGPTQPAPGPHAVTHNVSTPRQSFGNRFSPRSFRT